MTKREIALRAAALAAALAVFGAGGYYIGKRSNDISSAIPREELTEPPTPPADAPKPEQEITYVTRSDVSAAAEGTWTKVSEYETDFTEDGKPDKLTIYTSAEAADGEIMWDDGQSWIAEIEDAQGGYYTLMNSYVNNGCAYAQVSENEEHDKSVTVIVTNGSGLSLKRYKYSSSGFMESRLVNDEASNVLFSSVPFYK